MRCRFSRCRSVRVSTIFLGFAQLIFAADFQLCAADFQLYQLLHVVSAKRVVSVKCMVSVRRMVSTKCMVRAKHVV